MIWSESASKFFCWSSSEAQFLSVGLLSFRLLFFVVVSAGILYALVIKLRETGIYLFEKIELLPEECGIFGLELCDCCSSKYAWSSSSVCSESLRAIFLGYVLEFLAVFIGFSSSSWGCKLANKPIGASILMILTGEVASAPPLYW